MAKFIGAHVSIAGGVEQAPENAAAIGARAFALFTKNQRQWRAAPYSAANRSGFAERLKARGFDPRHVLPHGSYLINLAHPDDATRGRAVDALVDELDRCAALGLDRLVLHPGSSLGQRPPEAAAARVAESVDMALARTKGVRLALEVTAGQGSCVGASFEELAAILSGVQARARVGACLDTAHLFAAGVDLRTRAGYDAAMAAFERVLGWKSLCGVHLNDSKVPLGSRVDRHESLGKGHLGWKPFGWIVNDPRFDDLPLILETPDESRWPAEIKRLYGMVR